MAARAPRRRDAGRAEIVSSGAANRDGCMAPRRRRWVRRIAPRRAARSLPQDTFSSAACPYNAAPIQAGHRNGRNRASGRHCLCRRVGERRALRRSSLHRSADTEKPCRERWIDSARASVACVSSMSRVVVSVVGARPQFVKAAAVSRAIAGADGLTELMVHTGQHFDAGMSDVFFEELGIPPPALHLGIHGGSHGEMTGRMLPAVEAVLLDAIARTWWWSTVTPTRRSRRRWPRRSCTCRSPTWRRGCGPSTGGCPRRSTGSSPTTSAACLLCPTSAAGAQPRARGDLPRRAPRG